MSSMKPLLKVNFLGLLHLFNGQGARKKKKSTKVVLLFIAAISLYVSGLYSFMVGDMLSSVKQLPVLIGMMSVVICVFSLMFTAFGASGIVFGSKDMDFTLSLPVSAFQVMLAKVMALYLENLMLCLIMMIPCGVAYIVYGGQLTVYFVIAVPVLTLFLALMPTILALIVGYCLAVLHGRFKGNAVLNNMSYLIFFAIIMIFAFRVNTMLGYAMQESDQLLDGFKRWLLPIWFFIQGWLGSVSSACLLILITAVPFLLIVFIFSKNYVSILSKLTSTSSRADYRMKGLKARGQFGALFKKELSRYWGTPIYLFNTGFGSILAIGGSIYICIKQDMLLQTMQMYGAEAILVVFVLGGGFIFSSISTAAVSISLEGKNLWILKEAPIDAKNILMAKGLLNAALIWVTGLICITLAWVVFEFTIIQGILLLLYCFIFGVFVPAIGLWLNLLFPKMDAPNDMLVVKQSLSAITALIIGMAAVGTLFGGYYFFGEVLSQTEYVLACTVALCIYTAIPLTFLIKRGERKMLEL